MMLTRKQYLHDAIDALVAKYGVIAWRRCAPRTFAVALANCPSVEEISYCVGFVGLEEFNDVNYKYADYMQYAIRVYALMGEAALVTASLDGVLVFKINPDYM